MVRAYQYSARDEMLTIDEPGWVINNTFDDGPNPISVTFDRSESTNLIRALTVRCAGPDGHVIRTVAATSGSEDSIARQLIRQECR